jgi:surface adhesion protein
VDVGKFEQLTLDKTPVSTTVTDEPGTPGNEGDLVKVTITADQTSVAENVKPTFTVHINQPLDHDLVVTLSNNARSPSRPATPARRTSTLRRAMTSTTTRRNQPGHQVGGGRRRSHLREPGAGRCGEGQVTDTTDEVVAKLTATPSVTEGGEITYTITLTNKDGLPINNHGADLHAERRQNRHHRAGQRHHRYCHRHRAGQRLHRHQRPCDQIDRNR